MTPTARSLAWCRERGWLAGRVDQRADFPDHKRKPCALCKRAYMIPRTVDLFGFADLLALIPGQGPTLIQVTSGDNAAARKSKITDQLYETVRRVLEHGVSVEVWSWAKRGPAGRRKLWRLRRERLLVAGCTGLVWGVVEDDESTGASGGHGEKRTKSSLSTSGEDETMVATG